MVEQLNSLQPPLFFCFVLVLILFFFLLLNLAECVICAVKQPGDFLHQVIIYKIKGRKVNVLTVLRGCVRRTSPSQDFDTHTHRHTHTGCLPRTNQDAWTNSRPIQVTVRLICNEPICLLPPHRSDQMDNMCVCVCVLSLLS